MLPLRRRFPLIREHYRDALFVCPLLTKFPFRVSVSATFPEFPEIVAGRGLRI